MNHVSMSICLCVRLFVLLFIYLFLYKFYYLFRGIHRIGVRRGERQGKYDESLRHTQNRRVKTIEGETRVGSKWKDGFLCSSSVTSFSNPLIIPNTSSGTGRHRRGMWHFRKPWGETWTWRRTQEGVTKAT